VVASGLAVFNGIDQPRLIVELAFGGGAFPPATALRLGVGPGLGTATLGGVTWTDIIADVIRVSMPSVDVVPGEPAAPRTLDITARNLQSVYDPTNLLGPFVLAGESLVDLNLGVRVRSEYPLGTFHDHFYGVVDSIEPDDSPKNERVTFKCLDGLTKLARNKLTTVAPQWDLDTPGNRIGHLADAAGWPSSQRALDTGRMRLAPTVLGDFALALMDKVARTEYGWLYVDRSGLLTFLDHWHVTTASRSTGVQATFVDGGGMSGLQRAKSHDRFWNDVHILREPVPNPVTVFGETETPDQPLEQVGQDQASIAKYEVWSYPGTIGELCPDDLHALAMAQWVAPRNSTPQTRIRQVNVDGVGFDQWADLLELRHADRIRVLATSAAVTLDVAVLIQGVGMEVDLEARSWDFAFSTDLPPAAEPAAKLVLGGSTGLGTATLSW
jgi:hypothetical protein